MNFIEKYNLGGFKILKILGILVLGIFVLYIVLSFVSNFSYSSNNTHRSNFGNVEKSTGLSLRSFGDTLMDNIAMPSFSSRNIIGRDNRYISGMDAENFELTEYWAKIETRKLSQTCQSIMSIKSRDYVIFESSNSSNDNCNFRFKVRKDNTEEILDFIKSFNPEELNENIKSIKKQINDFTSEEDILKRKLQTMEDTLSNAIVSYDKISELATATKDAHSLASIIESKIKIIERLTSEKINTTIKLERISKLKAEQIDKLEYTYFNVNVYENKYVDTDQLKSTWKYSIKKFVGDMNGVFQDLTIGLIALIVFIFKYLVYLLIIVLIARFVWSLLKRIWNK